MHYTKLGRTELEVSALAFGSLTLAPMQTNPAPEQAAAVLCHAMECGVNFIDTAQLYDNYEYIRLALHKSQKDLVIASKTYAYEKQAAFDAVEQARRALDRDVIDIFLLHEQESEHTLRGHMPAVEELLRLKAGGAIRAFGISTHHVAGALAAAHADYIDILHPLINLTGLGIADGTREEMESALRLAHAAGKGIYTMKPLGGGNLLHSAGECLAYAFDFSYKHAVCIGMQSVEEVDANIEFMETGAFSGQSQAALSQKKRRLHIDAWCTGCGRCAARCKSRGMTVKDGRAVPTDHCVLCGYCSSVCPEWAIKIL